MQKKITTFLTFDGQAEEAMNLYTSVIPNSRITSTRRYGAAGPGEEGSLMTGTFELDGQEFMALNGGPSFEFAQGFSLFVDCETQEEVDASGTAVRRRRAGTVRLAHGQVRRVLADHSARTRRAPGRRGSREGEPRHERDARDGQDRDRRAATGLRVEESTSGAGAATN